MKVLLDIDEEEYIQKVTSNTQIGALLRKGKPINDHVTITNGDVFKALYPDLEVEYEEDDYLYFQIYCDGFSPTYIPVGVHKEWWNKPYYEEKKIDEMWDNKWLEEVDNEEFMELVKRNNPDLPKLWYENVRKPLIELLNQRRKDYRE